MHPEAQRVVDELALAPHPEGGYYREIFRSALTVQTAAGPRDASTAIYFLLPAGAFSAWHRVDADEVWHHYQGDPLELHLIDERGGTPKPSFVYLGHDLAAGQRPQAVVPAGVWQAARPIGERYVLAGCTVAPGFSFATFEMPRRAELLARFPSLRTIIEQLTRG